MRQGLWSVDRLQSEAREFLRQCTIQARYEKGYDGSGHRLPEMVSNWGGGILPEIQRAFEHSPQWKEYEDILLEIVEAQAHRQQDESPAKATSSKHARRKPDPQLEKLRREVREMHVAGLTQLEMCKRLAGRPRPGGVAWRELDWPNAYRNRKYRASVRKWLSAARAL